ncbi:hypothetical protein TCAL_03329 [Tigriopus californicus]|uniref:Microtubule-associated protein Jupiter n=1 Tax=Tigriopus californicus TaxID=6832 RepID=A0A553P6W2_TIGCA|nr:hypothetical protein TCAL_03329 [Tigriopus californicus]|eukprot:TCALIF_03329-PA protein Name:"Protein of unknown function" AED:0.15 eAED:0.15 QI:0/0.33/0.5/0.5/0/0.25/4/364/134
MPKAGKGSACVGAKVDVKEEVEEEREERGDRVTRPPGGASTIFSNSPDTSPTQSRPTKYRMASSFELGDEQPSPEQTPQRRRSKPSVNPLTGELIGAFGTYQDDMRKEIETPEPTVTPVKTTRVPPGGHSTPLW